ncbi:MAG: SAM-dependent methyltransferase [Gammaproteobacteria bacterium]|nr:SAM-dependent methyltransferase [Gammaproteobacteria bacterium]
MDIEAIRKSYKRYAAGYDLLFGGVFHAGRTTLVQRMNLQPGDRVLEVGVGTGLSLPMYPADVEIVGIDLSPEMLERAERRCQRLGMQSRVRLELMDAEDMSFEDASFDKVAAMYVATVSPRPARLIEEMGRVCKPGGDLFILNHFSSANPVLGGIERLLAPLSRRLGWRPDFSLEEFLWETRLDLVERIPVNLFGYWMLLHARNRMEMPMPVAAPLSQTAARAE